MNKFFINIWGFYLRLTSKTHKQIGKLLIENKLTIATAESCTGGLVSSRLTDVAGSSAYVKENFVTYSYEAKENLLNVSHETLINKGAVSYECAYEMVKGLIEKTKCDIAICTTGIAGPTIDEGKPAGLIYIGTAYKNKITVKKYNFNKSLNRINMKFIFSENALKQAIQEIIQN